MDRALARCWLVAGRGDLAVGHEWLVSKKLGRIFKWVCSEGCRETFADRFWQERADDRQAKSSANETTP